ncbi:MAG: hypothetical protein U0M02_03020, partial [Acutalibacteraceae bacterium]|nr:hypothetical protein [Acutalibacteraceae bacterium]
LAGTARQEAQAAQTAANEATQAAQQAQATAQNFDGRITQAENDASQALEASRSFENRVQSAITTANNANQTATNSQGIAMRADQNAGAALDKIGNLSDLTTEAKQNLVAAINEAAASGGGGGGGGTTNYNSLTNKPQINGHTLSGNQTAAQLGLATETALNGKQNAPAVSGVAGQVLGLNSSLQPVWVDQTGGSGGDPVAEKLLADIIPGTTQTVTFDSNNKPATVVFSESGAAIRTDAFTWGTGTVTEVRALSSGEYITMVTDLTTLVTTMSAIQRGA